MEIPGTIKIVKTNEPLESNNADGAIVYHKQEISLKNDMETDYEGVVLWHEILHGVYENLGFEQDECEITQISNF